MTRYNTRQTGTPGRLAVLDIETASPPSADDTFPPWPTHVPIVASILTATRERYAQWQFAIETVDFWTDEVAALERVSHLIEGRTTLSFAGRAFDLPVLANHVMKHQRMDLVGISEAWQAHRFGGCHYDLADVVSGYGGARGANLEMLCSQLGIPAKTDCHGADVADMFARGEFQAIRNYCESDVAATLMLFACVEGLRSSDPGYTGTLISQFSRWVADCRLAHLQAFERINGHNEYDRLSLLAMVEDGIAALDHRQHLKFATNVPGPSGAFVSRASDF